MDYKEIARNVKADSFVMGSLPNEKRIAALASIGEALEARKEDIFAANKKDLAAGENLPTPV